jgi:hypothetical protein
LDPAIVGDPALLCDNFAHEIPEIPMLSILSQFWRIAQLKSGPEHLPASSFLLLLVTVFNIALSLTISVSVGPQPASMVATTILTNLAAQALLIFGLLYLVGKPARLTQTLIAYFGCDLLMNLVIGVSILIMRLLGKGFYDDLGSNDFILERPRIWLYPAQGYGSTHGDDRRASVFSDNGHCRPWPTGRWPNLT